MIAILLVVLGGHGRLESFLEGSHCGNGASGIDVYPHLPRVGDLFHPQESHP